MKKYLNAALHKLTVLLEFIISFVLAAGIIILLVQLILSMPNVPDLNIYPNYEDLVETCFNLIIGVELIRMLYQHKPSTVFEVLLFAIARQVIMAHNNPVSFHEKQYPKKTCQMRMFLLLSIPEAGISNLVLQKTVFQSYCRFFFYIHFE